MMSEELLTYCLFGAQRDFGITNRPGPGEQYVVGWGMRGRVGAPAVREAAGFVVQELLPNHSQESCIAALPAPVRLNNGRSWNDNLNPSGSAKSADYSVRPDDLRLPE